MILNTHSIICNLCACVCVYVLPCLFPFLVCMFVCLYFSRLVFLYLLYKAAECVLFFPFVRAGVCVRMFISVCLSVCFMCGLVVAATMRSMCPDEEIDFVTKTRVDMANDQLPCTRSPTPIQVYSFSFVCLPISVSVYGSLTISLSPSHCPSLFNLLSLLLSVALDLCWNVSLSACLYIYHRILLYPSVYPVYNSFSLLLPLSTDVVISLS